MPWKLLETAKMEAMLREWERAGVEVIRNYPFNPARFAEPLNHLEHRKGYLIDGKIGWTGGMGMQEKYRSRWHDTMTRVRGEAVRQMQVDILKNWLHLGRRIGRKGESDEEMRRRYFPQAGKPGDVTLQGLVQIPGEDPQIREEYLAEIEKAKKTFYLENPYLTDARIIAALKRAAQRGVDVRVVVPSRNDMPIAGWAARGEYDGLIKAGVRVYEYTRRSGMTHTKVAVRDGGEWSTFGSANTDSLSFNHLYEFNYGSPTESWGMQIQKMILRDIKRSVEVTPGYLNPISNVLAKLLNNAVLSYFL
jgi:cardiolipin synthase A/B